MPSYPMPSPLGGYVDPSQPRHSVESILMDIFQRHGLIPTTDVEQPSPYGGGGLMGMQLDAEAINKLKADKAAWDDTPAAEKIVNVMIELACRQKKDRPDPTVIRMVGIVPATNRAVIIVVYSFFPIAAADVSDLRKVGRWALGIRDERGIPSQFSGDIHDHEDLKGALETVTAICAKHKEALKLDSLVPSMLDDPYSAGPGYRSARAYAHRPRSSIILAGADGELAGASVPTAEQLSRLTPEQITSLRATAIRTGIFDQFIAAFPDQPPMTDEESHCLATEDSRRTRPHNDFPSFGSSEAPPIPLTPP